MKLLFPTMKPLELPKTGKTGRNDNEASEADNFEAPDLAVRKELLGF